MASQATTCSCSASTRGCVPGNTGRAPQAQACAEDGSFSFDIPIPPGDWKAQLFGKDRQRGDGTFHIDATTGCAPLLLVTERKVTISGIVVDDRGQELPDVVLRTENGDAITSSGPSHGKFRLVSTQQVSGPTRILLENPGDWTDSFVPPTVAWGQDDVRIVIPRVPDMTIEVVDQQGAPVEQFGVLFLPTERASISISRECKEPTWMVAFPSQHIVSVDTCCACCRPNRTCWLASRSSSR